MVVPDSYQYLNYIFPDPVRMPLYPWLLKLGDTGTIQIFLWGLTGYMLHRRTGLGLLYFTTIGLIMLSQKILTETLFVFVITLAVTSKKDMRFIWICVSYFVKPIMLFFIPVILLSQPKWKYTLAGIIPIVVYSIVLYSMQGTVISTSGVNTLIQYTHGIGDYLHNLVTNSLGKSVGLESIFLIRLSQLQVFTYTLVGLWAATYYKRNLLFLLPTYLILISGIAGCQGDRLHIVIVPVCLMFINEFLKTHKINNHENTI